LETRRVLEPKVLKLINFLRNIVSNIEIQGCHVIGEKDGMRCAVPTLSS